MRSSSRHPLGVTIVCASFVGCSAITSFDGFVPDGATAEGSSGGPDGASSSGGPSSGTSGSSDRSSSGFDGSTRTSSGTAPCIAPQSTGPKTGDVMTNRSASSGQAWVAIANVDVTDGKTADVELSADKPLSYSLRVSGFAFGVPAGARIRGVHVRLRVQQTGTADIVDEAVTLFVGSQLLSDSQDRGEPLPPSYATVTYGGDDQMWGLDANTLTPAAVNSPSFGVSYQVKKATSGSASAHVDEISVEVHYCE